MAAASQHQLRIIVTPGIFAIVRFTPGEKIPFDYRRGFFSVSHTPEEVSLVCLQKLVPRNIKAERSWRLLRVAGSLDFALTGVLASLTSPLANAKITVFVISTFDTDYLLIRNKDLARAITVLERAGHTIQRSTTA